MIWPLPLASVYAIMMMVYTHINSVGCYFKAHSVRPLQLDLRLLIEEVMDFPQSPDLTLSDWNLLGTGPTATMVNVCDKKRAVLYNSKKFSSLDISFNGADLLCTSSFMDGWNLDDVVRV